MLLYELLEGIGEYRLFGVRGDTAISSPFTDTREAVAKGLFICIEGTGLDGHIFAKSAAEMGASAVVANRPIEGVPTVVVSDTQFAAAVIWNNYYKRPSGNMRLFGITGTNGKTSTLSFLAFCLGCQGRKVGTIGTLGAFALGERVDIKGSEKTGVCSAMTTPDPRYLYEALSKFRDMGVEDVVMEVSSHGIAQRKVDPLNFYVGIFTNLTPEHLDYHKSMEEYFRVKASFVSRCQKRIVNADDSDCRRFSASVPSICVGRDMLSCVAADKSFVSYSFEYKGETVNIKSSVGGDFTVYNTLFASVAALEGGVSAKNVEKGIFSLKNVKGRMESVDTGDAGFDVIIDYAHTPDALEKVLCHLRRYTVGRLICVFGCGGERDRGKRPLMGRIAESFCDGVIVTSDNPRGEDPLSIIKDITDGMKKDCFAVIPKRKEGIYAAISMADEGDTVLLAGKGHETYEIGKAGFSDFDEREIVREAIALRFGK